MGLTILLTISTCLTMGTGNYVEGYELKVAKEKSNEILKIAENELNPIDYVILESKNLNEQNEILKAILINSFIDFDLCSDEIKNSLSSFYNIESSNSSLSYSEIISDARSNSLYNKKQIANSLSSDFIDVLLNTNCFIDNEEIEHFVVQNEEITSKDTSIESQDKEDAKVEQNQDNTDLIPLYEKHDNSKLSVNINQKINDKIFIGFDFPADSCISFYNIVSNWLNKKAMNSTVGTSVLWKTLVTLLKGNPTISSLMSSIISLLSSLWGNFMSFLTSTGALGIIVGAILIIAAIGTIYVICNIYIAGFDKKGWRIGTLIHSLFKWEWLDEMYD